MRIGIIERSGHDADPEDVYSRPVSINGDHEYISGG